MQIATRLHRHRRRVGAGRAAAEAFSAPADASSCSTSTPRQVARPSRRSAEGALRASRCHERRAGQRRGRSRAVIAFGGLTASSTRRASVRRPRCSARTARIRSICSRRRFASTSSAPSTSSGWRAAVMAQNTAGGERRARRDHQYRVDCRVRRTDRPAGLRGVEGRHRRADPAGRARVRVARHPRRDDRAWHLRYAAARGAARSRARRRSASRCRSRRDSAAPTNTRHWRGTSSRTRC